MRKTLLCGVAFAVLVGCSSGVVPVPTFDTTEQPTISVSKPPPTQSAKPKSISIPGIKAESSLIETGLLPDGTLETPSVHAPLQASWYDQSPRPGDVGPAVVLGHVDGDGKFGIFHRLRELKVGSQVAIERVDGSTVSFVAYRVERFNKDTFPTQDVYGNTEGSELRLITCGGVFNPKVRSYEDNIVVFLRLN